jgi:pheromone shutdown-related protein TraB
MLKYKNLMLIGTSHISKESIEEVTKVINEHKPNIVSIELDRKRYFSLMQTKKPKLHFSDIFRVGAKGFFFALIGSYVEKKLGDVVGVRPGTEMKTAIKLTKKYKLKLALIDQDIEITLKKLSKRITWKERWNFIVDIFKGVVFRKNEVNFDLTKVPSEELIQKMMKKVKVRYPNIFDVLVKERNEFMAKKLRFLMNYNSDQTVLGIVGAGHLKEMLAMIKK